MEAKVAELNKRVNALSQQLESATAVAPTVGSIARASLKLYLKTQAMVIAEAKIVFAVGGCLLYRGGSC